MNRELLRNAVELAGYMFYVYILKCCDSSLYTGYTNDLEARLETHRAGKGSKYVRAKLPAELVYHEIFETKSEAMKREKEIKSWSREQKLQMIDECQRQRN